MADSKTGPMVVGITAGDPAGIGPEVIVHALTDLKVKPDVVFKIIGSSEIFKHSALSFGPRISLVPVDHNQDKIKIGCPNRYSALLSLQYLKKAVGLLRDNAIQALVTGPVSKQAISELGVPFQGHTEFLANAFKVKKFEMMFVSKALRVVIVTRHIPIKELPGAITLSKVYDSIVLTDSALKTHFKFQRPNLAVCGLNPHAGEGGQIGKEEIEVIIPAIRRAQQKGIHVDGPFPADTLFSDITGGRYDAVIAMYHDQGLIPVKTLYFHELVNMTIGLPFIRTSPAHGTAFNIAGQHKANPASMASAIELAATLISR